MWKKLKELLTRKPKEEILEEKEFIFLSPEAMEMLEEFLLAKVEESSEGIIKYRLTKFILKLDENGDRQDYRATVQRILVRH